MCADGDPHPGCLECEGGRPRRAPWYRHEFLITIASTVAVSLAVALVVPPTVRAVRSLRKKKGASLDDEYE